MMANEWEKGTKSSQPLAEFGGLVLFRKLRKRESGRTEKFDAVGRWHLFGCGRQIW